MSATRAGGIAMVDRGRSKRAGTRGPGSTWPGDCSARTGTCFEARGRRPRRPGAGRQPATATPKPSSQQHPRRRHLRRNVPGLLDLAIRGGRASDRALPRWPATGIPDRRPIRGAHARPMRRTRRARRGKPADGASSSRTKGTDRSRARWPRNEPSRSMPIVTCAKWSFRSCINGG